MYIYERIVYFMLWKPLHHPSIQDGYMISPNGDIRHKDIDESKSYTASYHSNNGYDYAIFMNKAMQPQLFPIDEILSPKKISFSSALQSLNAQSPSVSISLLIYTILSPP